MPPTPPTLSLDTPELLFYHWFLEGFQFIVVVSVFAWGVGLIPAFFKLGLSQRI